MTTPSSTSSFFALFPLYVLLQALEPIRHHVPVRNLGMAVDSIETCTPYLGVLRKVLKILDSLTVELLTSQFQTSVSTLVLPILFWIPDLPIMIPLQHQITLLTDQINTTRRKRIVANNITEADQGIHTRHVL
jgi:hypothetical protein